MNTKDQRFAELINAVADCRLCCEEGHGISSEKLLHNFIAERPDGPRYGSVPNLWTDWANRLHAKIMMVGQDWGAEGGEIGTTSLRRRFEDTVAEGGDSEEIWRQMRKPLGLDASRTVRFFTESAKREGLPTIPTNFMDDLYLTNSVLCVRRGREFSGYDNFDIRRSILNCRKFLERQIEIVQPAVVVTLGSWPLWALNQIGSESLGKKLATVQAKPPGYIMTTIGQTVVSIIPLYHHAARPVNRSEEQQIEDYRYIWRALKDGLQSEGEHLMKACFPSAAESS